MIHKEKMEKNDIAIGDISAVLFDLDGTVYCGTSIIDGAIDTIVFFRERGKRVFFTTNNSTKTRSQIYERLVKMGVVCEINEILTSGFLAAVYAKKRKMKNIHIFGSMDLIKEFEMQGVVVNQCETAENLLIGYNPNITYEKMTLAVRVALHAKEIVACNKERVFSGDKARLLPGCGAMTAAIEWCAKRPCDIVIGKPNILMVEYLCEEFSLSADRMLVIGDTFESDIEMAERAGCRSVLIGKSKKMGGTTTVSSIAEIPKICG